MEKTIFNLADLLSLIKYPSVTEKAINLYGSNKYTFIVDRSLTKPQIRFVLEKIFNITILDVNTAILPQKTRRVGKYLGKRSRFKKAYITLKDGDTIPDLFN